MAKMNITKPMRKSKRLSVRRTTPTFGNRRRNFTVRPNQMMKPRVRWKSHGDTAAMRSPGRSLLNLSMAYHCCGNSKEKMTLALTWRGGTGIGTTTSSWSSHLKVGSSAIAIHPKATRCRIGVYPKLTSEMDMNLCRDRVHLPIFLHRNMRVLDPKATL